MAKFIVLTSQGPIMVSVSGKKQHEGFWFGCPDSRVAVFASRRSARVAADFMKRRFSVCQWTKVYQLSDGDDGVIR